LVSALPRFPFPVFAFEPLALPSFTLLGQSLLSGLFIGALYGLLGLGLSLSWGLLRQINLSHFALAFLGAYLTYQLSAAGLDPFVALLVVVPAFFLFGVLVHALLARFAITPVNSLLVTFGLTVMIESGIQWKWSADYRRLESAYGGIKFKIGELFVPLTDLVTLGLAVGLAFGIWAALRYTDLGRALRASAEDPQMAAAFGMNQRRLSLVLSGVSAALAGVAGLCIALSFTLAPA
jgi:branched-chain amino acid transport system permease protein